MVYQFGYVTKEVPKHIETKHSTIPTEIAEAVIKAVASTPGLAHQRADLHGFEFPTPSNEPIPYLKPPKANCKKCHLCDYIIPDRVGIRVIIARNISGRVIRSRVVIFERSWGNGRVIRGQKECGVNDFSNMGRSVAGLRYA
jgi:hypothetical protein